MSVKRAGRTGAGAVAAAVICVLALTTIEGQAPPPGPLLTDPTRGDLRMLLDKTGLDSGEVSIGERTYPAKYTSTEHVHQGIEILYVLDGEFHHEINGQTYVLNQGMIGVVKVGDKVRHKTGARPVKLLMIWAPGEEGSRVAAGWRPPA
jgi:quercetin dioxygenase-like cupin family protein